jgi:hypothetical protein
MTIGRKITLTCALASLLAVSVASQAFAVAQDYSSLTSGFSAELTAALPTALTAVGLFIGVLMAYKVVRRVLRA